MSSEPRRLDAVKRVDPLSNLGGRNETERNQTNQSRDAPANIVLDGNGNKHQIMKKRDRYAK